jgi:adenine deaminase
MIKTISYVEVARGDKEADLVLKNCKIVNVFTHEIEEGDVAIVGGVIVGIGEYSGKEEIDVEGKYVVPGFIDGHVHIESSMLTPIGFAKVVIPKGTTTCVIDPHEIGNVLGIEGVKYMIEASKKVPLETHVMLPSCVPTTNYETAGAVINNKDIKKLKDEEYVLGLGEVMDYPSVIEGERDMHLKINAMEDRMMDGHAPSVSGKALNAYASTGIKTDHECTTPEELKEKVARGMYVHLREGSATRNVKALSKGVTPQNHSRLLFCTDDKHPFDIRKEGHINYNIRLAIENGVDPIMAIKMATINTAIAYKLDHIGAIAPSYNADIVVIDNLKDINPVLVFKKGELVAKDDQPLFEAKPLRSSVVKHTVRLRSDIDLNFNLKLKKDEVKVMQLIENNVTTNKVFRKVKVENGLYVNNPEDDILKLAVVERHIYSGNIGLGLVEGYGLKNGAVAMTIAHDSHNLIIIGDNDSDMQVALREIEKIGGGITVVSKGKVIGTLPLEVGGLMTNEEDTVVEEKLQFLEEEVRKLGVHDKVDDPFLTLAFLSLPVIPALKVTDQGLFDVAEFKLVGIEKE